MNIDMNIEACRASEKKMSKVSVTLRQCAQRLYKEKQYESHVGSGL